MSAAAEAGYAGAAMEGNAVNASRGPAMLNSDMKYAEFSSTPPLAAADSPVAQPRPSPVASPAPASMLSALVACLPISSEAFSFIRHRCIRFMIGELSLSPFAVVYWQACVHSM